MIADANLTSTPILKEVGNSEPLDEGYKPWSLLEQQPKGLSKFSRGPPPFILPRDDDLLPEL